MTPNEKGKKVLSMYKYTYLEMMIPHTTIYIYGSGRPRKYLVSTNVHHTKKDMVNNFCNCIIILKENIRQLCHVYYFCFEHILLTS